MCRGAFQANLGMEHRGRTICPTCYQLAAGPGAPASVRDNLANNEDFDGSSGGGFGYGGSPPAGRPVPRPGGTGAFPAHGGIRRIGTPTGGSGFSHGPGPLLLPLLGVALVTLIIGAAMGKLPQGIGFCVFVTYTMGAAVSAVILHIAAALCGVQNIAYPDSFKATAAIFTGSAFLGLAQQALQAAGRTDGAFFVGLMALPLSVLLDIAAIGFAYELGWGKSILVWLIWFVVTVILGVIIVVALGAMLFGAAASG